MISMIQAKNLHESMATQMQSQYKLQTNNSVENNEFKNLFAEQIQKTNELQHVADVETQKFIIGETDNIHDVMIAMEEATISLEMVTQVRNKCVEAYQELKNIQL